MNVVEVAEAPVVRRAFSPQWATTTTTTIEHELPNVSTTSEVVLPQVVGGALLVALVGQNMVRAVPRTTGNVLLFEGAPEQVGLFEDAIASSHVVPGFLNASAWGFPVARRHGVPVVPSPFYVDELMDWDFAIEAAPKRPGGTLTVTLKYAGRGTPTPVEDPWD